MKNFIRTLLNALRTTFKVIKVITKTVLKGTRNIIAGMARGGGSGSTGVSTTNENKENLFMNEWRKEFPKGKEPPALPEETEEITEEIEEEVEEDLSEYVEPEVMPALETTKPSASDMASKMLGMKSADVEVSKPRYLNAPEKKDKMLNASSTAMKI